MAKINSPLLSLSAHGIIGERLVYSVRSSGQQARYQKKQNDKITDPRLLQRNTYSAAVAAWRLLTDEQKQVYIDLAQNLKYTGYNYYIKLFLDQYVSGLRKAYYGVAVFGESLFGVV